MKKADALTKLNELKTEFETAAAEAVKPRFFQSWFDDNEKNAAEYRLYAQGVEDVIDALENSSSSEAAQKLSELDAEFETLAIAWDKAARALAFWGSWISKETKKSEEYFSYTKKTSAILELM